LDVLNEGLWVAIFLQKRYFIAIFFMLRLSKTLDPNPDSLEMLDPQH
jgi:hypothetical protein